MKRNMHSVKTSTERTSALRIKKLRLSMSRKAPLPQSMRSVENECLAIDAVIL
jgi:hypothetical protein